ncbi:reverse transcriptase family protein [Janthinobacterium sp. TND4EL3]|uniref:reverse transcriptase family protein n=1 Tax=Janthinobacterium sp. TND4EL3 TaxID=1907311 RepID=UPI0009FB11FD|nr:reverse transcriptase family protein [Janthinobacterium sp. TND4EL3]
MAGSHKIYYSGAPIGSVAVLAKALDISEGRLLKIANNVGNYYISFEKPVKGKMRSLSEPILLLKILQKRILNRIFCHIKFPHYLHGGIKATNPRDFHSNASAHLGAEVAITLDIKSFFPNVTSMVVENSFLRLFQFPDEVATVLAKLTMLNNQLPQGAPTSSCISNIILFDREYKIAANLEAQGFQYTRLIDDITISSKKKISSERVSKVIDIIAKMLGHYGLKIHPDKTHVRSKGNPLDLMTITGLWINRGSPKLDRKKCFEISCEVIQLKREALKNGVNEVKYHTRYSSVAGKVALLERLNHSRATRLKLILDTILPTYNNYDVAKVANLVSKFCKNQRDSNSIGYLKKFYQLQHAVSIVKRTHVPTAKSLQALLNIRRPKRTMSEFYG